VGRQQTQVTELSASTGKLVKVMSGSRYGFDEPYAVSSDGTHVWVTITDQSNHGLPSPG
jgi:hypothetical protein